MRILILDDMQVRHDGFQIILKGHELFHALTFEEAQTIMSVQAAQGTPVEMCCLDRDLNAAKGASSFSNPATGATEYYTGEHFAYWLGRQDFCPKKILIHSWNETGAAKMKSSLEKVAGIEIQIKPYKPPPGL